QVFVEPGRESGLVVEGLQLRRRAQHMQIDGAFSFRREVRQTRQAANRRSCLMSLGLQQRGQRDRTDSACAARKKLAPRFGENRFRRRVQKIPPHFTSTSSRFNSSLATIVIAAS